MSYSMEEAGKKRRFQNKLKKIVRKYIALVALISSLALFLGQLVVVCTTNQINAVRRLNLVEQNLLSLDGRSRDFLDSQETIDAAQNLILSNAMGAADQLQKLLTQFENQCGIDSEILIVDQSYNILHTSTPKQALNPYLINFNRTVCHDARDNSITDVYRAVYYEKGDFADVMYVKPVSVGDEVRGYISVFLSGSSWNFSLAREDFDGVITDMDGNVMYVSKPGLLEGTNKFSCERNGLWRGEMGRYWVASKQLPRQSAIIYSLVYFPPNNGIWVSILILLIISAVWYKIVMWTSRVMAFESASSIEMLKLELQLVREDPSHRIHMNTSDEFEDVGNRINELLEWIMCLSRYSDDLSDANAKIEYQELTEQINPHFLYNTLETIRNLAVFSDPKAEEIITDLADILRYMKDEPQKDVPLAKEMEYLDKYLNIQKHRFGDNLHWRVDISPECFDFCVPKLLIQPIVENSIKHGYQKEKKLNINIIGRVSDGELCICVSDNGGGIEKVEADILEEQLSSANNKSQSIGLQNLSRRLYLRYGIRNSLRIVNDPGIGFRVYITNKFGGNTDEQSDGDKQDK